MQSSVELLKKLKEQHDKRAVSVLVGAGFSKNAIWKYPGWDELLRDLVQDVYGRQIEERYRQYRLGNGPYYYTEELFKEKEIENIIHDVGYLDLVSKYIQDKGYREAIDVYIEDHLPYVEEVGGLFKVTNMPDVPFSASNLDVHKELLLCKWKHVYTTNYDNLLELANDIHGMDYRKITVDYKLAELSEHRGIVKVHGSLVGDSLSKDYEFDNDKSRRYIISAEDYATYAEKHQAFSYQMKTGLLTGVFCLIGFSGNDPNFLGWLEWMKDVLDRDITDPNKEATKVYLLTIGEQKIEKSRQLFYQNHHIGLINILDGAVLKLIGAQPDTKDIGAIFTMLFRYLNDGTAYVVNPLGNTIANTLTQYQRVWAAIDAKNVTNEDVSEVRRLRKSIVMPPSARTQRTIISNLYDKKEWNRQDAELFALACFDCGLWFFKFREESKDLMLQDVKEWQKLQQMGAVLCREELDINTIEDSDWKTNLTLARSRYDLAAQSINDIALKWDAQDNWLINKAAVLAQTHAGESLKIIDGILQQSTNAEHCYYASVLGNVISMQLPLKYSYNQFKAAGINGYYECRDAMLKTIEYEKKEVKPYGGGGWSFVLAKREEDVEEALRFVVLLFITGFPLQCRGYSLITHQDWYEVFKRVFGYMPYVSLFYSLQLTDKNTLVRIGQDYAFAEPFKDITPDLLKRLLIIVADEHKGINRESCLWVAKEMLCSVPEDKWFNGLIELVNKTLIPNAGKLSSLSALYQFMKDAAYYIKAPAKKSEFLDIILSHFDDNTYYFSELIYKLQLKDSVVLTDVQRKIVNDIFERHPLNKSYLLAAHLGYSNLLDDYSKNILKERIKNQPQEVENASFEVLHSLTFLTYGDEEAGSIIKRSILKKDIWHCGIEANSASEPNHLSLNKTSKDIKWTQEEMRVIMENLQKNLVLLEGWNGISDSFFAKEHVGLLADMLEFTEHDCIATLGLEDYKRVAERIKVLMLKFYGSSQMLDKIFDKEANVNQELQFLARCIDFYGLEKYRIYVDAVMDRALLQCEQSLTMMLAFVEFLVEKHINELSDERSVFRFRLLLEKYVEVDYQKLNLILSVAYRCLHKVAEVLKEKGLVDDQLVNYWLEDEFVNRFS